MKLQSSAQAGQDVFAYEVTGQAKGLAFLDVGAHNLCVCNNSYSLERMGWKGLCTDIFKDEENLSRRTSPFIHGDARTVNWEHELTLAGLWPHVTYLSLDCDAATLEVLGTLPFNALSFDVITIETDEYVNGPEPRAIINECLTKYGYDLVCDRVKICIPGYNIDGPFEIWAVSPKYSSNANRFRSEGKYFGEILEGCL